MTGNNTTAGREFVITRVFNAPRDLVWQVHTECRHLMHWWGPKGFTMRACKIDLRPGGIFHYCLQSPDGQDMWGKFVYREIVKPERLVFVVSFSDAKGGITRHPMSSTWPLETLSTTTFIEHHGQTAVTVHWSALNAGAAEQKAFDEGHESMKQGFGGTFDQLADYLTKVHAG